MLLLKDEKADVGATAQPGSVTTQGERSCDWHLVGRDVTRDITPPFQSMKGPEKFLSTQMAKKRVPGE